MDSIVLIRKAQLSDLETLLGFEQEIIEVERPLDPSLNKGGLHYYDIPEMISEKDIHLVVAVCNNAIVGSGYVRLENSNHYYKNPIHGYIGFMYVKNEFRGKKISHLILESLKFWSKEKKIKELRLDVYSNNLSAVKAYKKFGFTKSLVNMRIYI